MAYAWPGNVRELRNALGQAPGKAPLPFDKLVFNLGPAASSPLTLGTEMPGVSSNVPFKEAKEQLLATFEMYVTTLLDRYRGNVTKAAAAAGLSRKHMHDLMKKIELTSTEPDE